MHSTRRTELFSEGVFGKVFSLTCYNFITNAPIFIKVVSNESYKHILSSHYKL